MWGDHVGDPCLKGIPQGRHAGVHPDAVGVEDVRLVEIQEAGIPRRISESRRPDRPEGPDNNRVPGQDILAGEAIEGSENGNLHFGELQLLNQPTNTLVQSPCGSGDRTGKVGSTNHPCGTAN